MAVPDVYRTDSMISYECLLSRLGPLTDCSRLSVARRLKPPLVSKFSEKPDLLLVAFDRKSQKKGSWKVGFVCDKRAKL